MKTMRNVMMKLTNWLRTRLKIKKKNKRFRPFCLCPPDVMFVTLSFLSLILFPTLVVVNDVNFGSTKVIQ